MDLQKLYNENENFRSYVDHYCKKYIEGKSIPVEEALQHQIVKEVASAYTEDA